MDKYNKITGLPVDTEYLECNLPLFLIKSIEQMKVAWQKKDNGTASDWDCDYCELQSNINIAEVEQIITPEQAWHLREKYLHIKRSNEI